MKQLLLSRLLAVLLVATFVLPPSVAAADATVNGGGEVATTVGNATFVVTYDGDQTFFEFTDRGSDPARTIALGSAATVDCLGGLFGGQAVRISGTGTDSAMPGESVEVQAFVVDGGSEVDRVSVKVRRADQSVSYFAPMRDLQTGSVQVACSP